MQTVSYRRPKKQAKHAVRLLNLPSQGSERNYEQALKGVAVFLQDQQMGDLRDLNVEKATIYLEMRGQEVRQKTLDLDRQSIQVLLGIKLPVIKSELETVLKSRAYTPTQAKMVADAQSKKHSLSTLLSVNSGLRAHELLTLLPMAERAADSHRTYRNDRFTGYSDFLRYTVKGKGGLLREVGISKPLAEKLEAQRLAAPRTVYDRNIGYLQYYDIGGGKQWSNSFSAASNRSLGWSQGAHGLRHTYAQSRMYTLQLCGYNYVISLEIVSQEMGHFRPEITEVYLR
jgi:integrase